MEVGCYLSNVKTSLLELDSYTQKSKDIYEKIIIKIGFDRASSIINAIHNNGDIAYTDFSQDVIILIKQYIDNHQVKKACYKRLGELNEHRLYNAIIRIIYDEIDNLSFEGEINLHYIIEDGSYYSDGYITYYYYYYSYKKKENETKTKSKIRLLQEPQRYCYGLTKEGFDNIEDVIDELQDESGIDNLEIDCGYKRFKYNLMNFIIILMIIFIL